MLVLALVGVAPEDIAADYELSAGLCDDAGAVTEGLTRAGTTARAELLRTLEQVDLNALVAADLRAALRAAPARRSRVRAARPARRAATCRAPRTRAARPGSPPRSARRSRTGAPGSASSRLATTVDRQIEPRELVPRLERPRARHLLERVGDRLGVLVRGQPLAQHRLHRVAERLRHARLAVGLEEALHPALAQPARQRVPALEAAARRVRVEGRRDQHQRRRPLRMLAGRSRTSVCAPIEAPASTARSIPRSSSTASRSSASAS